MIERRILMTMMLVPLLIFGIHPKCQGLSANDRAIGELSLRRNLTAGRTINPIGSWNRANPNDWQIAARGEVSEDCLLYGICADDENDENDDGE